MIKKLFTKKIIALTSIVFLFLYAFTPVLAAYDFKTSSGLKEIATGAGYSSDTQDPEIYIGNILLLIFSFISIIFMALVIYAGVQWMTAQGNTSQVSKAKDTLIKSLVGLVIIMASYAITFFVISFIQAPAPERTNSQIENN